MSDHAADVYERYDPFNGDRETGVEAQSVKVVTTRKEQKCISPSGTLHPIPIGTRARYEKAVVDGKWASYYVCVPCMDDWIEEWC